jgi:hypothetical protein
MKVDAAVDLEVAAVAVILQSLPLTISIVTSPVNATQLSAVVVDVEVDGTTVLAMQRMAVVARTLVPARHRRS